MREQTSKLLSPKKFLALKLRSVVLHVTCTRAHIHNNVVANSILVLTIVTPTSKCAVRGHICACVLAIDLHGFCDTPRVLHSACASLILFYLHSYFYTLQMLPKLFLQTSPPIKFSCWLNFTSLVGTSVFLPLIFNGYTMAALS